MYTSLRMYGHCTGLYLLWILRSWALYKSACKSAPLKPDVILAILSKSCFDRLLRMWMLTLKALNISHRSFCKKWEIMVYQNSHNTLMGPFLTLKALENLWKKTIWLKNCKVMYHVLYCKVWVMYYTCVSYPTSHLCTLDLESRSRCF